MTWLILALPASWLPLLVTGLPLSTAGLAPLAVGLAVAALLWALNRGRSRPRHVIPPGDILYLIPVRRLHRLRRSWRSRSAGRVSALDWRPPAANSRAPCFATAGLLWLSVLVLLLAALLWR